MNVARPREATTNPWLAHPARIADITPEIDGVATYFLEFVDPAYAAQYQFRPGQFNMLYLPGVGEVAISVSGSPHARERLPHTIRVAGNVTGALARLGRGGHLGLRGPYGSNWPIDQFAGADVILVGGGIGLAPLRPAIYELLAPRSRYRRATLLYGARTPAGLLYDQEYVSWVEQGLHVQTTVDRSSGDWSGNVGVVTLLLARLDLPDPSAAVVLVCGPEVMMRYVAQTALNRGIPEKQIWLSTERNMQCAVGLCGHCQLGPTFICKDGPIFRHDAIAPYLRVEGL